MKTLLIVLMLVVAASAWGRTSRRTSWKASTTCKLVAGGGKMEDHPWRPKGVWKTVNGMKVWCKNNCVRCNVACPANCEIGVTSVGTSRK